MNRKILLWLVRGLLLAAASVLLYQFLTQTASDRATASDEEHTPQMIVSHASGWQQEHELKALEGELQKNPDHVPILLRLAQVSRESGKLADAVRYLRDATTQDPRNADASLELGRALFETGNVNDAIHATEHALEINPSNVDALYNLGAIYGNLSQDNRARQYWQKAVSVAPESDSGRRAKESLAQLK
jgi:Flp pilus assembly protein TadD